jgi:hypothetical protein
VTSSAPKLHNREWRYSFVENWYLASIWSQQRLKTQPRRMGRAMLEAEMPCGSILEDTVFPLAVLETAGELPLCDYAVVSSILYRSPCNLCGVFIRANHSSSLRCSASNPRCHQLQMFRPTFTPLVTGNPACTVSFRPRPSSSKFSQKTAAPFLGLKVTPSLPFSHSKKSHHLPSLLAANIGNSVPPPSHAAER